MNRATVEFTHELVDVDGRLVHCRLTGQGPIVLVLPAGNGIAPLAGLIASLLNNFSVLAPDLPGYGLSDPLPTDQPTIADYASLVSRLCDVLAIRSAGVFGSHTGAAIAAELAAQRPDLVSVALLHELSFFSDEQRSDYLQNYLPTYQPDVWGTHLLAFWHRYRDQFLFRPWHRPSRQTRQKASIPDVKALHEIFVLQADAGDDYRKCYEAVLRNDLRDSLARVAVPFQFVASDPKWLEPVGAFERGSTALIASDAMADHCLEVFGAACSTDQDVKFPGRRDRSLVTAMGHVTPVYEFGKASATPPIVLVPDLPGPACAALPLAQALSACGARVVLIEVADNGDSISYTGAPVSIDEQLEIARTVLASVGVSRCHIVGIGLGSVIAAGLASTPGLDAELTLVNPPLMPAEERQLLVARYPHDIQLHWSGSHLIVLWHLLRNESLYWPRFDMSSAAVRDTEPMTDPGLLDRRAIGILKHYATYGDSQRALLGTDLDAAIALLDRPPRLLTLREAIFSELLPARTHEQPGTHGPVVEYVHQLARLLVSFGARRRPLL